MIWVVLPRRFCYCPLPSSGPPNQLVLDPPPLCQSTLFMVSLFLLPLTRPYSDTPSSARSNGIPLPFFVHPSVFYLRLWTSPSRSQVIFRTRYLPFLCFYLYTLSFILRGLVGRLLAVISADGISHFRPPSSTLLREPILACHPYHRRSSHTTSSQNTIRTHSHRRVSGRI